MAARSQLEPLNDEEKNDIVGLAVEAVHSQIALVRRPVVSTLEVGSTLSHVNGISVLNYGFGAPTALV
jgi:hypothetical protein